jgi:hypothetical protein
MTKHLNLILAGAFVFAVALGVYGLNAPEKQETTREFNREIPGVVIDQLRLERPDLYLKIVTQDARYLEY